ncbi:hypothetical protein LAZ67_X002171, partial [Cordylochernes scorpioides]
MAQIQPPETFDFSTPNEWPKWRKRFERYLVVSGMKKKEEADKIDLFMYLMGDRADDIFRTFKFEKEEEATKIDSVLKAFDSHFCVRKNIIYERAKFNSRIQEDREPVDEFITSLYKLADSCELEGLHEQLIRDRIVVGVRDKALSERMQLDSELTLEKAVKMVRQQEAVRQQQVDLQRPSTSQKVNQVKFNSKKQSPKQQQQPSRKKEKSAKTRSRCPKCGGFTRREEQACRAEGQKCNLCSKTGHFANCCPDKQAMTAEVKAVSGLDEEIDFLLEVSAVEDSSNLDDDEGECRRRWTAEIQVNGKQVKFKLDSQADVTCVPLCLFKKIMGQQRLVESDINLRAAEFSELQTVGMFISMLRNGNYEIKEKIYVIRRLSEPLLSRRACELLNLARRIEVVATRINPIKEFPEVFEGLEQIGNPYEIKLKPGAKPYAVHTPRRLPIPLLEKLKTRLEELDKDDILTKIFEAQQEDTTLNTVVNYLEQGWPDKKKMSQALLSYWHVKDELGVQNGLLMRSCRLVIPASMKLEILDELHAGHFGITKTRLRACETVWWHGISEEIAETVRKCSVCIQEAVSKHEPLIPTNFPTRPWQKIGMHLFKFENKWYLVVIDYYSRFPEMIQLDRLTANVVVRSCKSIFARHGIPETVVSDNGTQFGAAREFANFARQYGFTHVTSSPRFPQSNGMAEAGVKIAKLILKKNQDPSLGLLEYRSTPLENGYSPAELLMGRKLRTTLPIAPENLNPKLVDSQTLKRKEGRRRKDMKSRYDRRYGATDMEELSEGDTVWITDMRTWGIVKQKASTPRSYMVDTPVGTLRRNRFHLRKGVTVQYPADPSTPTFSVEELLENEKTPVVDYPSNDSEDGQIRTRSVKPKICNTIHKKTTSYHPQTNGQTERMNRTLTDMISMYIDEKHQNWDDILPFVTFAYNSSVQETTGYSPYFLIHGREPLTFLDSTFDWPEVPPKPGDFDDYISNLLTIVEESKNISMARTMARQDKSKQVYDKHRREVKFSPDDLVLIWTPIRKVGRADKLQKNYIGPFKIIRKTSTVNYEVEEVTGRGKKIVHVSRMKLYRTADLRASLFQGGDGRLYNKQNKQLFPAVSMFTRGNPEHHRNTGGDADPTIKNEATLRRSRRLRGQPPMRSFSASPTRRAIVNLDDATPCNNIFFCQPPPPSLEVFGGYSDEDPSEWLEEIELLARQQRWPDDVMLAYARSYMDGPAKKWAKLNSPHIFSAWSVFKKALLRDFRRADTAKFKLIMDLQNRIQQPKESTLRYAEDVFNLCNKVNPKMTTDDKLYYMKTGLNKYLSLIMMITPCSTVKDFLELARRIDQHLVDFEQRRSFRQNNRPTRPFPPRRNYNNQTDHSRSFDIPRFQKGSFANDRRPIASDSRPTFAPGRFERARPNDTGMEPVGNNYRSSAPTPTNRTPEQYPRRQTYTTPPSNRRYQRPLYQDRRICWNCSEQGHISRYCPRNTERPTYNIRPIQRQFSRSMERERERERDETNSVNEDYLKNCRGIDDSRQQEPDFDKKDGTFRFCVDYRNLNSITVKDQYPLPRIDDCFDSLHGSRYFTSLDLCSGYWQVEVEEQDREKTAFVTPDGLYHFNVLPFGLCNGPATFERLMDNILRTHKWKICLCYLDDVIDFSEDLPSHLTRLKTILGCLRKAGLTLNLSKCRFAYEELLLLGHVVSKEGITPDPEKNASIKDFPALKTIKNVRAFLGLCSYYRRFIKEFSKITYPLQILTRKNQPFVWGKEQESSFLTLKEKLSSPEVLTHYDPNKPIGLHTDASDQGLGAVLIHVEDNGRERPISYPSRTLQKAETNYSTTEKECLAIIWAIGKFSPYLYGRKFIVYTDNHSLCWMAKAKKLSGRLARWSLELQAYDFTINYKSGKTHLDADGLSRCPIPDKIKILLINYNTEDYDAYIKKINNMIDQHPNSYGENFTKHNGKIHKKNPTPTGNPWLLVIPKTKQLELLEQMHDHPTSGHMGIKRTYSRIKDTYFWPSMFKTVEKYVSSCPECQFRKTPSQQPSGKLQPIPPASRPFERIGIDLLGRIPKSINGNRWIVVCTDYYSRHVETAALPRGTATEIADSFLKRIELRHGAPKILISDRGSSFLSKLLTQVLKICNTIHKKTTSYHPQTNGQTERMNRTLTDMISMYIDEKHQNWDEILPFVTFAYNSSVQETTGYSPYFLIHGREPLTFLDSTFDWPEVPPKPGDFDDYISNLLTIVEESKKISMARTMARQDKSKQVYDKHRREVKFSPDDLVLIWTPIRKVGRADKLQKNYIGPFKIIRKTSPVNYEVKEVTGRGKKIVHVSIMKLYRTADLRTSLFQGG